MVSMTSQFFRLCSIANKKKLYLFEHRPNKDMTDEEFEHFEPWSEDVQNKCKNIQAQENPES